MKSNKVKNPCKICLQTVTHKTGLQCQGACRKWAHFKCLNYTPGKIQDIKSGAIKVTCPCPDCNAGVPKDILTNPPILCTNTQCPANKVPAVCSSTECSSHGLFSQSSAPEKSCALPKPPCPPPKSSSSALVSPCPPPRPPVHSPSSSPKHLPGSPPKHPPCPPPKHPPCPPPRPPVHSTSSPPKHPPCPPPKHPPGSPPGQSPLAPLKTQPSCPSTPPVPTKKSSSSCLPVCPSSCQSGQKARNIIKLFPSKQSQSCYNMSEKSSCSGQIEKIRSICSDSNLRTAGVDPKMLFATIETLCSTVGELSTQLRNLMCEMQTAYGS